MPSSVTITPRKLFKEDLQLTTSPNAVTSSVTVLGAGLVSLNAIDAVLYSAFPQAASDSAASTLAPPSGPVGIGEIYYNTSTNKLKVRMS